MVKYRNLYELAEGFKKGELVSWILMVDNDSTYLRWIGSSPDGSDEDELVEFEDQKNEESEKLYDGSNDIYILDQALTLAGIPNEGV